MIRKIFLKVGSPVFLAMQLFHGSSAHAATSAEGSAFGVSADLQLLPALGSPVSASIAPTPSVSGSAPADFDLTDSVVSAGTSISGAVELSTGAISVSSASSLGANQVDSAASADNTSLSIALLNAVSLAADAIESSASASCSNGTVVLEGQTALAGASLSVLGLVNIDLDTAPSPNTSILPGVLGPLGLSIVLNEQIVTGDSLSVNALRVNISGGLVGALGTLSGDVVLAQSQVEMPDCELPNLAIAMSGPASATVGTSFDYTITLDNIGLAPTAGQITVSDTIPAELTIDSVSAGSGFACTTVGQVVSCTSSEVIDAGAADIPVAVITVTPDEPGNISNTSTVSGGGDQSPANNTTPPLTTAINPVAGPDILVDKSAPAAVVVGAAFDYDITLSNVGSASSSGTITVTDNLPAGVELVALSPGALFTCSGSSTITCDTTDVINAGISGIPVVTLTVRANSLGSITNIASVAGGNDLNPANNDSDPASTEVQPVGDSSARPIPTIPLPLLCLLIAVLAAAGALRRKLR